MFNRNGHNNGRRRRPRQRRRGRLAERQRPQAQRRHRLAEHELLWDGLSPAVTQALGQPLDTVAGLTAQGPGRQDLRLPRRPRRHRPGQPHLRIRRMGIRAGRRRDATPHRDGRLRRPARSRSRSATAPRCESTVAGALPRADVGVHPVTEDTFDGHDTAIKGAVTDGMKRAFRSFGLQFGNGFYGDQAVVERFRSRSGSPAQPQPRGNGRSAQPPAAGQEPRTTPRRTPCASASSRSPSSRASTRGQVGTAVVNRTGKSIDDLTAAELGPAGAGRRQQAEADRAGPGAAGRIVGPDRRANATERGGLPTRGLPRSLTNRKTRTGPK